MNITAIVGSYRKGRTVDTVIDAILSAARETGAETSKVYLMDQHIQFCTNCRQCTQQEGPYRGACPLEDDMSAILDALERIRCPGAGHVHQLLHGYGCDEKIF